MAFLNTKSLRFASVLIILFVTMVFFSGDFSFASESSNEPNADSPKTEYKELKPVDIGVDDFRLASDDNYYQSEVIEADFEFNAVGFVWNQPEENLYQVKVRTGTSSEELGSWVELSLLGEGKDGSDQVGTDLYFPDQLSRYFQYRVGLVLGSQLELDQFKVAYLNSGGGDFSIQGVEGPGIVSRGGWGCDENLMNWTPEYSTTRKIKKVITHHTAGPNNPSNPKATIRGIYYYHAVTLGWGDIGYNFLVDQYGNIYKGRRGGDSVIGGHARGYNGHTDDGGSSLGIAVLGTFNSIAPTSAARRAIEEVTAWKAALHGFSPNSLRSWEGKTTYGLAGHRDYNSTGCPGNAFYNRLPTMRAKAQGKIKNYTRYSPAMRTYGSNLYQVTRGFSNYGVYTRAFNGSTWSGWNSNGKTLGNVSIATFGSDLYQAVRGFSGNDVCTRSFNGTSWSSWSSNGRTAGDVSMVEFNGKLYQAVKGLSNKNVYTRSSSNGTSWSSWSSNGRTAGDVSMVVFDNKLYQAVKGLSSGNVYTRSSSNGTSWSSWSSNGRTAGDVSMAVFDSKLYQAVRGNSNSKVYTRSFNGSSWSGWQKNGKTAGDVSMVEFNGKLYQAVRGLTSSKIYTRSFNGSSWSGWSKSGKTRSNLVAMEVLGSKLYQAVLGYSTTNVYTRSSSDGISWSSWKAS